MCLCEFIDINECASNPCQHNATCVDDITTCTFAHVCPDILDYLVKPASLTR